MNRISARLGLLVGIAVAITAGCTRDRESVRGAEAAARYRARYERMVIPDGTSVVAKLESRLSTETNRTGDRFDVTTIEPIIIEGRTALPAGARIHGALRDVEASGRSQGRARMTLVYEGIVDSEGMTCEIAALPLALEAASGAQREDVELEAGWQLEVRMTSSTSIQVLAQR